MDGVGTTKLVIPVLYVVASIEADSLQVPVVSLIASARLSNSCKCQAVKQLSAAYRHGQKAEAQINDLFSSLSQERSSDSSSDSQRGLQLWARCVVALR